MVRRFPKINRLGNPKFSLDGALGLDATSGGDRDGLTDEERIELCKNQCFIITGKDDKDLWPYDDRYEEPITS